MKFAKLTTLVFLFLKTSSAFAWDQSLNALELTLTPFQKARLMEDFPFTNAHVAKDQRNFFLLGNHYFWKWNIDAQKMSRIRIPLEKAKNAAGSDQRLNNRILVPYGDKAFVIANEKALLFVNLKPLKFNKVFYPKSFRKDHPINAFFDSKSNFYVLFSSGTWISTNISDNHFSSLTIKSNPLAKIGNYQHAEYRRKNRILYLSSGGNVSYIQNWPYNDNLREIINIPEPIISMEISANSLYAVTRRHVLRFQNKTQRLMQIIPVTNKNSILTSSFDPAKHAYILQNQSLYLYDLKKTAKLVYKLPFEDQKEEAQINFFKRIGGQKYALLRDGFPFVLSLPQKL